MTFEAFSFGVVELLLGGGIAVISWLWRQQSAALKDTISEVTDLRVGFAEAQGTAAATNRTMFAHYADLKEAIGRIEDILIQGKGRDAG